MKQARMMLGKSRQFRPSKYSRNAQLAVRGLASYTPTCADVLKGKKRRLHYVNLRDTLYDASLIIINQDVNCLLVEQNEKWVGTIDKEDIIQISILRGMDPEMGQVIDAMTPRSHVYKADETETVPKVIDDLAEHDCNDIVVVEKMGTEDEKAIGILGWDDLATALGNSVEPGVEII
ncbi:hypothetical protein AAMO2058_000255000 [Amorphochlora amoebiformis]